MSMLCEQCEPFTRGLCRVDSPMEREKLPPGACVFCRGTGEDKQVDLLEELLKIDDSDLFDKPDARAHSAGGSRGNGPRPRPEAEAEAEEEEV